MVEIFAKFKLFCVAFIKHNTINTLWMIFNHLKKSAGVASRNATKIDFDMLISGPLPLIRATSEKPSQICPIYSAILQRDITTTFCSKNLNFDQNLIWTQNLMARHIFGNAWLMALDLYKQYMSTTGPHKFQIGITSERKKEKEYMKGYKTETCSVLCQYKFIHQI